MNSDTCETDSHPLVWGYTTVSGYTAVWSYCDYCHRTTTEGHMLLSIGPENCLRLLHLICEKVELRAGSYGAERTYRLATRRADPLGEWISYGTTVAAALREAWRHWVDPATGLVRT